MKDEHLRKITNNKNILGYHSFYSKMYIRSHKICSWSENKIYVKRDSLQSNIQFISPRVGFEPTTVRLTTDHSTTEQLRYSKLPIKLMHDVWNWKIISRISTQKPVCNRVWKLKQLPILLIDPFAWQSLYIVHKNCRVRLLKKQTF